MRLRQAFFFKPCGLIIFSIIFILFCESAYAQSFNAYLTPTEIFVGDRASLTIPLPAANANTVTILRPFDPFFPSDPKIDFHSIILERNAKGSRLIIEFTAYTPGVINFPVIEIEKEYFSDISITVNSSLDTSKPPELKRASTVLVMPGTATMLYGALAAVIIAVIFSIWFVLKGRAVLRELHRKWKRRMLFVSMKKTERNLRRLAEKEPEKRVVLDGISVEFKNFLSVLTDINCRAMTAREFEKIPSEHFFTLEDSPAFLGKFFRSCDNMRFSGLNAQSGQIISLLDELKTFIDNLDNSRKNKQKEEKAA